jgi:hypothetical protein
VTLVYAQGESPFSSSVSFLDEVLMALSKVPMYGWIALLAASIIGGCAYVGSMINQMRRDQRNASEQADRREFEMLGKQRERDVAHLLENEDGWQTLIAQVAADATATGVAIDSAGILHATIQPTPYFNVRAVDGREFCFTVDPQKLQIARVISKKAQLLDVTRRGSMTAAVDLQLLWGQITLQRRLANITLPRHSRWYCIVKNPEVFANTEKSGGLQFRAAYQKR